MDRRTFLRRAGQGASVLALLPIGACRTQAATCAICGVAIPDVTRAVIRTGDGTVSDVCDPRCALTLHEQTGTAVTLLSATDYNTGDVLDPPHAYYVTGSDVVPDAHQTPLRTSAADVAEQHWHRCVPSVLAFASANAAARFQQEHGGQVVSLAELGFAPATPG